MEFRAFELPDNKLFTANAIHGLKKGKRENVIYSKIYCKQSNYRA